MLLTVRNGSGAALKADNKPGEGRNQSIGSVHFVLHNYVGAKVQSSLWSNKYYFCKELHSDFHFFLAVQRPEFLRGYASSVFE